VLDNRTLKGISGVDIFHDDDMYVTDNEGEILLKGKWNYKGNRVSTYSEVKGYMKPNLYQDCINKTEFEIQSKHLSIFLEKMQILKLSFELDRTLEEKSGCFVLDDLPQCSGEFQVGFTKTKNSMDVPGIPGWDESRNYLTFYIIRSPNSIPLRIFYDCKEGWDIGTISPDISESIAMDPINDTTYYTVQLK
jgi:hypothetical protein